MRTIVLVVGLGVLTLLVACGGDDDGDDGRGLPGPYGDPSCAEVESKLRECGITEGDGAFGCRTPSTPEQKCQARCFLSTSCDDIEASVCASGSPDLEVPDDSPIGECLGDCRSMHLVECTDGSEPIDGARPCNGSAECDDGSDEEDCAEFECADGDTVPMPFRCDGGGDCVDGSDEEGCVTLTCG